MKILSLYNGEQLSLADLIYVASDTPRQGQQDITHGILAPNGPRILRGFVASFAQNKVTVGPGSGLLNFKQGNTLTQGLIVAEDAAAQTVDVSTYAPGTYGLYVTFNSLPSDMAERSIFQSDGIGFTQDSVVNTRFSAAWTLAVKAQDPGEAYVQVATLSLPDGAVTDTRPLLFEGNAQDQFAPTWGTDADRDAARGNAPISDLETMIAALKVAIEDIKGARWYEKVGAEGVGGGGTDPGGGGTGKVPDDLTANSLVVSPVAGDTSPVQLTLQNASQNAVFRVDADGNTQVAGTLQSGGLATLASINAGNVNTGTLTVNDAAQFKAGLDVLGKTTLGSLETGNALFSGSVSVSDLTTGNITAQSITSTGGLNGKDLSVSRNTVLAATQTGGLQVGAPNQPSPINAYGPLTVRGASIVQDVDAQNVTAQTLNVKRETLLEGALTVDAKATAQALSVTLPQNNATNVPITLVNAQGTTLFSVDNQGNVIAKGSVTGQAASGPSDLTVTSLTDTGALSVAGLSTLQAGLSVTGQTSLTGALQVTAATTLGAALSVATGIGAQSLLLALPSTNPPAKPITLNDSAGNPLFTVDSSGNVVAKGTVTGQTTAAPSALTVSSLTDTGTLSVQGASTLAALTVQNAATLASTLAVSGLAQLKASATVTGTLGVSGTATANNYTTTLVGSPGTPAFGFGSSGLYFNAQYGQLLESVAGFTSRGINYLYGPPNDVGVSFITHNQYSNVSGPRDAHRFFVNGSTVALSVLGTGGVAIAADSSIGGVTTTAGLALSSGVIRFADGTTQSTAPAAANPGSAAKFSATSAGTAASPAFTFTGATNGSGLYFDATPGNVFVAVNGAKSLFSTAASGAASGANGWAIQSTLGAGSNLLALYGAASITTPVLTIDGVGKLSGQSVSVTGSVAAATLTISGPSSVAAVTATGTVTAANLTLATGGTLTFADGTTQTTAGGGGSASPSASYSATATGTAASPAFKYANANNGSGVYFDGAAGNVLVSANGAKTLFTRAANGAAVGASGVGIASTLGTGAQVLGVYGNNVDSTVPANAQMSVDGAGLVTATALTISQNGGKLTFGDGTSMTTAATGGGSSAGAASGLAYSFLPASTFTATLSATPQITKQPGTATNYTFTPTADCSFFGVMSSSGVAATLEVYNQTTGVSLVSNVPIAVNYTGFASGQPYQPGQYTLLANNTYVFRLTGSASSASVYFLAPVMSTNNGFLMQAASSPGPIGFANSTSFTTTGQIAPLFNTTTAFYFRPFRTDYVYNIVATFTPTGSSTASNSVDIYMTVLPDGGSSSTFANYGRAFATGKPTVMGPFTTPAYVMNKASQYTFSITTTSACTGTLLIDFQPVL